MLICPQCQFENPNTNKFCQHCGTSLTHKVCAECGTNVALNEERCQNCGAQTGTVWWAIISRNHTNELVSATVPKEEGIEVSSPLVSQPEVYLDQQGRYQLLEPLPAGQEIAATTEVHLRVLDCQPFQLSPLEAGPDSVMEIPAIAKTYLTLQSQFHQELPAIHDAWQQGGIEVVLIADRSNWPQLIDLWHDDTITTLQILHWLYEMVQLWAALEPWHCRQSLLELSNLRVDEDGVLGLQRLYAENEAGKPLTVQDLGQMWQRLFQETERTQFGCLLQLNAELQAGNIQMIDDLRSRLEAISNELQTNVTSSPEMPPQITPSEPEKSDSPLAEADSQAGTPAPRAEVAASVSGSTTPTVLPVDEQQDSPTKSDDMPTLVLPMHLLSLEDAGSTDVGRQRHHNEDFFGIETTVNKLESPNQRTIQARGLYILCDGMGGHAGGEVASTLAVKTLQQYFQTHWQQSQLPTEENIREAVLLANRALYDMNQQDDRSGTGRMGTTLVMVLLQDTQVAVAHVGDSRLYQLTRKRGLEQVTLDHEVGQREMLRGIEPEIAYGRPDAYQLTQALGPRDENFLNPDVQFLQLSEDTLFILTSDGLSDHDVLEQHWQTHLEPLLNSETGLEQGVSNLIDLGNQYNGHDNITAIVILAKVYSNQEIQN